MRKNNRTYLLVILAIIVLLLIPPVRSGLGAALNFISQPLMVAISDAAGDSKGFLSGITEISSIREENKQLADKLAKLQIDETELNELRHENKVLKSQLGFLEQYKERELITARIIAKEPFGVLDKLIIDKGSTAGVKNNSAVVSDGILIGKVVEVSENQAKITLITSKDSIIQAMLQESRTLGIIRGSLEGPKLENIPQDTPISPNEKIVTSGLGGGIEQGILIGRVGGEVSTKSEIYKVLNIDLAIDLNKLEYVFVIK